MWEPLRTRTGTEASADRETTEQSWLRSFLRTSRLYGVVRAYFRSRPERGEELQRRLNQARMGVRYDEYLARAITRSAAVGVLAGVAVFALLLGAEVLFVPGIAWPTALAIDVAAAVAVVLVVVASGWSLALYLPHSRAEERGRRIDILLPQGISYLYALSAGGGDITRVIRSFSDEEAAYGEVAQEFDHAVRDMDYFGNDPLTALQNVRDLTPSDNLATFLDDLVSTVESGGDIGEFLRAESDKYFDRAQDRQRGFLDQLSTLAEVYVGAVIVGPLFLLIVLLLISLVGGEILGVIYGTVYLLIPGLLLAVLFAIVRLSRGYGDIEVEPSLRAVESPVATDLDDDRLDRYLSRRRFVALRALLSRPLSFVRERPERVLWLSVPLAVAVAAALAWLGLADPSPAALTAEPVRTTTVLLVVPMLVAVVPLSVLHEARARRESTIVDRFPDFLNQLSTANEMGLNVSEALDLVARRTQGPLADELRKTANDSYWTGDFPESLDRLADRLGSAQAARTLTLVETASRVSGDIHQVLNVAARDANSAARLRRDRLQEMQAYTVIVAVSFCIYLAIVLMLDVTFLSTFADLAERVPEESAGPVQFSRVDPAIYRMVLFHSTLLQAAGSGIVAGKMGEDSMRSGLKYSVGMVVLTVVAFLVVVGV